MASQPPPQGPPQPAQLPALAQATKQPYHNPYLTKVAWGVTPIALIGLVMPPRKFNINFVILTGCALWGMNQLRYDYTGKSMGERLQPFFQKISGQEMPEKAQQMQIRIREEKERREQMQMSAAGVSKTDRAKWLEAKREKEKEARSTWESIWMGDEDENWKEKRDQREKEALQEGGVGIWGLITEQISEVWSAGKKKEDGGEDKKDGKSESGPKKS